MTDTEEFPAAWWPRPTMRMSRDFGELAKALAGAQAGMKHPARGRTNPQFGSTYADLASVIDAVKVLNSHDIAVMGSTVEEREGVRVVILFAHSSGQWQEGSLAVPVPKLSAQGLGSACTYGRRYLLSLMCNVASEEDDDGNEASKAQAPPPAATRPPLRDNEQAGQTTTGLVTRSPLTAANVAAVRAEAAKLNASDADVAAWVTTATKARTTTLALVYADEIAALRAARDEWKRNQPQLIERN